MGTSFEESPQPHPAHPGAPLIPAQRHAPPDPPPPEPVDRPPSRWPWLVGGLVAGLLVGATTFPRTTVETAPPVTVTAPAPPPETVTVTVAPAPAAAAGPLTTFASGVWEVGVDIAAGKYETTGTDGYGCYYARLRTGDGSLDDIIKNGFVQGPATVVVKESDGFFETSGCEGWVRVG